MVKKEKFNELKIIIPHILFWMLQIFLNLLAILLVIELTAIDPETIPILLQQNTWQIISQILAFPLLLLPLATTAFIIYYHYIKKQKLKLLKLIFNYEIPITLLSLTALAQQWINPGQILILTSFYIIILIKILLSRKQIIPMLQNKKTKQIINSIITPIEQIITLYYIILAVILFATLLYNLIDTAFLLINPSDILGLLILTVVSLVVFIGTAVYLPIQIIKKLKKQKFNWLIYGISAIITFLLLITCGYINQHYSTNSKSFDHPLFVKLIHTKNYEKKQKIKKEIASNYSRDDFSQTLSQNTVNDPDNYYISIEDLDLSNNLPIPSKLKITYRHYLSVLLPLKRETSKKIYKERVLSSIYGCDAPTKSEYIKNPNYRFYGNCIQLPLNTSFESREVTLNSINEKINQNSDGTISSKVTIETNNPQTTNGQFSFKFKLPNNSVITGFHIKNQKTKEWEASQLVPKNIAEKVYQEEIIKNLPKDPAVLTQLYKDYYQLKVFPIPPESNYDIKITYIAIPESENLKTVGFKTEETEVSKTITTNKSYKSTYYTEQDSTYLITQAPKFTTEPIQSKVVYILDNSYSMKNSLNISKSKDTPYRIYESLQKQNISPLVYTINNGINLETGKYLRYINPKDFYGYSNRKLAFNKLFLDRNIWGTKLHIIYLTDDTSDLEFEDSEFTNITEQSLNNLKY